MNQQIDKSLQSRLEIKLLTEDETQRFGELISKHIQAPLIIYLKGELGVGKTRLVRAIIQSLGYQGNVKSPTYTLVEPYQIGEFDIQHFDLYRIADPEELEYMGIRDYFGQNSITFIEWPDNGKGWLAEDDILISLDFANIGRTCTVLANSESGILLLNKLKQTL